MKRRGAKFTNETEISTATIFSEGLHAYRLRQLGLSAYHNNSDTALYLSCERAIKSLDKSLIDFCRDGRGYSLLHLAVGQNDCGRVTEIKQFIEDINSAQWQLMLHDFQNAGYTPLMLASKKGYHEMATILITYGANVNQQGALRFTALMLAAKHGKTDICKLLLSKGAEVNMLDAKKNSALMHASMHGNKGTINCLLWAGAKVNLQNKEGETALDLAIQNGLYITKREQSYMCAVNGMLTSKYIYRYENVIRPRAKLASLLSLCAASALFPETRNSNDDERSILHSIAFNYAWFCLGVCVGTSIISFSAPATVTRIISIPAYFYHLMTCEVQEEHGAAI